MALPQYLKTTDPSVIATIERNEKAYQIFVQDALAWAEERGFDNARNFRHNALSDVPGAVYLTGLAGKPDESRFGEWTMPKSRCSSPKKANKSECAAMNAIRYVPEPLPGLPANAKFGQFNYTAPNVFVHDGVAYAGYGQTPFAWGLNGDGQLGPQWSEIPSSEFGSALEAHQG